MRADATCLKAILIALRSDSISTMINLSTKIDQYEEIFQKKIILLFILIRFTPLHLAAMTKNGSECIKILLYYDHANVDAKDRIRRTPIMYAIINGIDSITIGMFNNLRDF